jgi:hypothetical protein
VVTDCQFKLEGKVRAVHVIPSVDEAAVAVLEATATKTPVVGFTVTEVQVELEGKVRAVHVIPSVDEAATGSPSATATKRRDTLALFPEKLAASEHVAPAVPLTSGKRSLLSRF